MRQTGETTRQILDAPRNAVYVWVSQDFSYIRRLVNSLQRTDLLIVGPAWITEERWRGRRFSAIILDHAVRLKSEEWAKYQRALTRVGI